MDRLFQYDNFKLAPAIDAQARAAFLPPNPRLEQALTNSAAKGLPQISVLPLAAQHLSILTQLMGAKTVLEVGTLGGYSSICFAEAGAKVTSIEIDPKHREVALENVKGLDVDVILGSALDVMPKLAEEGKQFDLVFIDAEFDEKLEQFDWAVKLTRPGGCIFLDDVVANMIKEGETEADSESTLTKIGRDERVTATLMPLAVSHPMFPTALFNGFVLARVNSH
ncbi:O-methyltransferase [Aspergillus stella-maris]|uniref:O-methyltransferase n=1 Tax=Aspergillus stella-maris TaxID=1810926 RepID=UPI003CCD5A3B